MKKFLIASALALSLAGCASTGASNGFSTAVQLVTTGVQNPISKDTLYKVEATVNAAVVGLVQYRRACLAGNADANCRSNIRALQVYTRKIPPVLASLRVFVKNNDQVNALTAYNTIQSLLTNFRAQAAASGIGG